MKTDHIELYVPDREEAAGWYGRVLGFEIMENHRAWAVPGGPLMITNDGGDTMIALFEGPAQGAEPARGLRRLAFRVGGHAFVEFIASSGHWRTPPLGPDDIGDHEKAISVYFTDPYGTPLEVTTYEPQVAREGLGRNLS
ncbi:MAG: VOC family protein [Phycisphaerales bacterium]|nr:VOC family protein [Phycisphaerae bacterium]NNF43231.1 VOC family protein [Phycisphaerales bacterium]NNM25944.1 VOC family protein [Phycisphaerales bacterium]